MTLCGIYSDNPNAATQLFECLFRTSVSQQRQAEDLTETT